MTVDTTPRLTAETWSAAELLGQSGDKVEKLYLPEFQRSFVWKEKRIKELVADLREHFSRQDGVPFFQGSIILYRRGDKEFEIINGQQRITTLALLYSVAGEKKEIPDACASMRYISSQSIGHIRRARTMLKESKENEGLFPGGRDVFPSISFTVLIVSDHDLAFTHDSRPRPDCCSHHGRPGAASPRHIPQVDAVRRAACRRPADHNCRHRSRLSRPNHLTWHRFQPGTPAGCVCTSRRPPTHFLDSPPLPVCDSTIFLPPTIKSLENFT